MKKNRKEIQKTAKNLFKMSFKKEVLKKETVLGIVDFVKNFYKAAAFDILKAYTHLIQNFEKNRTIEVEVANTTDQGDVEEIRSHFEQEYGKKLTSTLRTNSALLGGLRVTLGDDQWDFSTKGKINKMKEALRG